MILVRLILIFLIVYLLVRGFFKSLSADDKNYNQKIKTPERSKKISKNIGEYVDYEEKGKKD